MVDPDADIRLAAFQHLHTAMQTHGGALPWATLTEGFTVRDRRYRYASAAEGIFRPVGMSGILSVKTVVPKPRGRIWYHDQSAPEVGLGSDVISYAFTGTDPQNSRNRWLHDAMERQLPLIYFFGIAPAIYEPLFPAFVVDWNEERLSCGLSFSPSARLDAGLRAPAPLERRYALRTIQQRLHQAVFRERVLAAYGHRCALSGLPEPRLVDAAHIVPDRNGELGQPDICNGICMSKIHHAAYDADLIGVDPDFRIHVSGRLLALHDGPMLEQGLKALAGQTIRLPTDRLAAPDRDRLAHRFKLFRSLD